jgi:predicted dehydrogenase/threonine dehydrogenase-like Zn-dependent dehydrogenase
LKQIVQNYKSGKILLIDIPRPMLLGNGVIVRNYYSLISTGTERTKIETGKMGLFEKAKSRPDLVKKVLDNIKNEGLYNTTKSVFKKLEDYVPLGYSSCGEVVEVSDDIRNIRKGDLVACGGSGYANHAEYAFIPKNLFVKIPKEVDIEDAAFAAVGSIALQSFRLTDCQLNSKVMVIGLGLIGQLIVQVLNSSGIEVFGTDIEDEKIKKGFENKLKSGANINDPDLYEKVNIFTDGNLFDAIIIAASSSSKKPIEIAGRYCREKGKVVVVGAVKMEVPREDYYNKEISIVISRSYGPGRYDKNYEERGLDYPFAYVRWTENRNMQSFLDLIANKKISIGNLISKVYDFYSEYDIAYKNILRKTAVDNYGFLFKYNIIKPLEIRGTDIKLIDKITENKKIVASFIGSGNYAQKFLIPLFAGNKEVRLNSISSAKGLSSVNVTRKNKFEKILDDPDNAFTDEENNLIIISTRHDTHSNYVIKSLKSGKNVFVEKPLCLRREELEEINKQYKDGKSILMVGFNRRFSRLTLETKKYFDNRNYPIVVNYRINSGKIEKSSWIQDIEVGGGRIIGELCHFIDFANYIIDKKPLSVYSLGIKSNKEIILTDTLVTTIEYDDGSIASISYLSNGNKLLAKEYIEIFGGGISGVINDFKNCRIYTDRGDKVFKVKGQDKGQAQMIPMFINKLKNEGKSLISFEDIYNTTSITFLIIESLKTGNKIKIED